MTQSYCRWALAALGVASLGVVAPARIARADDPQTVTVGPDALTPVADGTMKVSVRVPAIPAGATVTVADTDCHATFNAPIVIVSGTCGFAKGTTQELELTYASAQEHHTLKLAYKDPTSTQALQSDAEFHVTAGGNALVVHLYWRDNEGWHVACGDHQGPCTVTEAIAHSLGAQGSKVVVKTANGWSVGHLSASEQVTHVGGTQGGETPPAQSCHDQTARATDWCPNGAEGEVVICYDVTDGSAREVQVPSRHVLRPNTAVLVVVRHWSNQGVTISLGGKRGLVTPAVDNRSGLGGGNVSTAASGSGADSSQVLPPPPRCMVVSSQSFGPRKPGNADATVEIDRGDGQGPLEVHTELNVEQTYSGAIRLGFGSVFGGAVDRAYAVQTYPGSDQGEVVATGGGSLDVELVLGFAPFLETFFGGRGYNDGQNLKHFPWGFSPYVGLGLVGSTVKGTDALTSLHLGIEWEGTRGFSVALTAVARRVHRLLPGIHVGDAVDSSTDVTRQGYEWGFGFVVNVSPDFLQVSGAISGAPSGGNS